MRTRRIELDGEAGHVAIERQANTTTIRIDSIIRDPKPGEQAWTTWTIEAGIDNEALYDVAKQIQQRADGRKGTNSEVHDYLHDLQRFTE
jgi:hypothetical protein